MLCVYEVLEHYSTHSSDHDYKQVRTALLRYVLPGWEGPVSLRARMTNAEVQVGLDFLKTIPVSQLSGALDTQTKVFSELNTSASSRRNYRHHLSQFIKWVENNCKVADQVDETVVDSDKSCENHRFFIKGKPRETAVQYRKRLGVNRKPVIKIALDDEKMSPTLRDQIAAFRFHRLREVEKITVKCELEDIRRYLGWLHSAKGISLDDLCLDHVIPFVRLNYSEFDFLNTSNPFQEAAVAEKRAMHEAKNASKTLVQNFQEYKDTGSNMRSSTATKAISSLISLAKWIYRDETESNDFNDIQVVVKLRSLKSFYHAQAKREGDAVPYALKSAPWNEMNILLETLKKEADLRVRFNGAPRSKTGIAYSMQRLLAVVLFVAMPPRRSRVIAQLEVGRTLQRGRVNVKEGIFTPEPLLKPNEDAKWCFVLTPKDYKTGPIYGRQSFEINDLIFRDGTTLYGYLEEWLQVYRPVFSPKDSKVFVKIKGKSKGLPAGIETIYGIVTSSALRILGKPVSPKELRKMFVSFITNRPDITEADLEAAARAMGHSRRMQMAVYDQVTSETRLATGMELSSRLWKESMTDDAL